MFARDSRFGAGLFPVFAACALLGACSDAHGPTALQRHDARARLRQASQATVLQPPQPSLEASSGGLSLALDLSEGTVSDNAGNIADLTVSEAALVATALETFRTFDEHLPALEAAAYQNPGCGNPGGWCDELRSSEQQFPTRSGPKRPRRVLLRRAVGREGMPVTPSAGKAIVGGASSTLSALPLGAAFVDVPRCRDIAESIYYLRVAYDNAKNEYFDLWESVGFGTVGGVMRSSTSVGIGVTIGLSLGSSTSLQG